MDYYYYIVDDVASSNKADLPTGTRVFIMPETIVFSHPSHPSIPLDVAYLDDGEGPYKSIRQLKENSKIYRNLLKTNHKRAIKIVEEHYLVLINEGDYALYDGNIDGEFHKQIYPLLLHSIVGSIKKNDVSGIHYFDAERTRVKQLIDLDDQTKVWQAYIEVYNPNSDTWVAKQGAATFFPKTWTYSRIVVECEYAYLHRVKLSETKYKGITRSGVMIVFIYDEAGKFKTVYPICEEL